MYRDHSTERCHTSAQLKMSWDAARDDNHFSDAELDEIEGLIQENYVQTEISRAASVLRSQLERIPDRAPNRTAQELLRDIEDYCKRYHAERSRVLLHAREQDAA